MLARDDASDHPLHRSALLNYLTPLVAVLAMTTAGCGSGGEEVEPAPIVPLFSFAVIADTHISSNPEHETRLQRSVDWINSNVEARQVELVIVLGDIGWGEGVARSKALLDELIVPYVPLRGDNELHGSEQAFEQAYAPQYERLSQVLKGWRKAPATVWDPVGNQEVLLQNMAFSHRGVHFFALDVCVRGQEDIMSEFGVLNDYEGGTLPWFERELPLLDPTARDSVIMLTHIPMFLGAFDADEMKAIEDLVAPYDNQVYANLAGHLHFNYERESKGFDVFVTDAVWDDDNVVRMIEVSGNGEVYEYDHEVVVVP